MCGRTTLIDEATGQIVKVRHVAITTLSDCTFSVPTFLSNELSVAENKDLQGYPCREISGRKDRHYIRRAPGRDEARRCESQLGATLSAFRTLDRRWRVPGAPTSALLSALGRMQSTR